MLPGWGSRRLEEGRLNTTNSTVVILLLMAIALLSLGLPLTLSYRAG